MTTKTVVEERLLDLALEEALAAPPAAARQWPGVVAAALFLCGIGVVAALLWQQRSDSTATVQEPAPAPQPEPVRANSPAELATLPPRTQNLEVRLVAPAELAGLRRFRDLRRLHLLPPVVRPALFAPDAERRKYLEDQAAAAARFADPASFAVLGELSTLQVLELPHQIRWTPEHFAFLRDLKLVELGVAVIDLRPAAAIEALLVAPALRTLRFSLAAIDAALLRALEPLRLERLELLACAGFDDAAWAALGSIRTLRAIEITNVREGTMEHDGERLAIGTMGDAAFDAFAALPALQHLGLDECEFPGDLLARLPTTLTSLDLGDRRMTWGEARSLRRLTALRALTFGNGLDEQQAAEVLPSWSLERLDYRGMVYGFAPQHTLLAAIAAQPRLHELRLTRPSPRANLAPLAGAPRLGTLELFGRGVMPSDAGIPLAQLEPLTACKALRTLRLRDSKLEERAVRERFGDRVVIELVQTTF